MTSVTNYSVCRAKGGPATCSRHKGLFTAQRKLSKLEESIFQEPSKEKLNRYLALRNEVDKYTTLIGVSEYNDLEIAAATVDVELQAEMKKLLSKRIDRIDVSQISWSAYVKAAVTFSSAQSYGSKIETLYRRKQGYEKIKPSEERGDMKNSKSGDHYEVKFSAYDQPDNQIDLVQIRPHHDLHAYHILAFNKETGETEFYVLSKDQMAQEVLVTGQRLAHGTRSSQDGLTHPEYAIRFRKGSDAYKRWQQYRKPVTWR